MKIQLSTLSFALVLAFARTSSAVPVTVVPPPRVVVSASGVDQFIARAPPNLSKTSGRSHSVALAASGDNVFAVWVEDAEGAGDIFLAHSPNGGRLFRHPVNVSRSAPRSSSPTVAVAGNKVVVGWLEAQPSGLPLAVHVVMDIGALGGSIPPAIRLSGADARQSGYLEIVSDGGWVGAVWVDTKPTGDALMYRDLQLPTNTNMTIGTSSSAASIRDPAFARSGSITFATYADKQPDGTMAIRRFQQLPGGKGWVPITIPSVPGQLMTPFAAGRNQQALWGFETRNGTNRSYSISISTGGYVGFSLPGSSVTSLLPANLVPTTPSIEFMVTPDQHTFGAWSGLANTPGGAKQHLMWIDYDARSGVPRIADSGSIENVFNDPRRRDDVGEVRRALVREGREAHDRRPSHSTRAGGRVRDRSNRGAFWCAGEPRRTRGRRDESWRRVRMAGRRERRRGHHVRPHPEQLSKGVFECSRGALVGVCSMHGCTSLSRS
jgi:hypothetical protein